MLDDLSFVFGFYAGEHLAGTAFKDVLLLVCGHLFEFVASEARLADVLVLGNYVKLLSNCDGGLL